MDSSLDGGLVVLVLVVGLAWWLGRGAPRRTGLTPSMRAHIWVRDGKECRYCGKQLRTLRAAHVDHVKPVVRGGTNDERNLVLACAACNLRKGARSAREAGMLDRRAPLLVRALNSLVASPPAAAARRRR